MNSVQPDIGNGQDYGREVPPLASNTWHAHSTTINNRFVPYERKKHLHLGYFKKTRGMLKLLQIIIALIAMLAYSDSYALFDATTTRTFCPVLITIALFFATAYSGFPHFILKDELNRNGMLYAELVTSAFSSFVLLILLACRLIMVIAQSRHVTDILALVFVQLPLAGIYVCDVAILLRRWWDISNSPTFLQSTAAAPKPEAPPRTVFSSNNGQSSQLRLAELSVPAAENA